MATIQYRKISSTGLLLMGITVLVIIFCVASTKAHRFAEGPVELRIYAVKADESEKKYQLIIKAEDQIDADAVPLYHKAVKQKPNEFEAEQIKQWLKLPVKQFPQEQAAATLKQYAEILTLLSQAAVCKQCNWPKCKPWVQHENPNEYRELALLLRLSTRLEISRGRYEDALLAMRSAFGMVRHLAEAPTVIQAQIGASIGCVLCKEIEQFVQENDSPNLYWALANLPRPLVDMSKAIEAEKESLKEYNLLLRRQVEKQLEPTYQVIRVIEKRLDSYLNALQCVEAIRNYAAVHDGRPPEKLSDISRLYIPKVMTSGNELKYHCTTAGILLKATMPKDCKKPDLIQYKIVLQK